MVDTVSLGFLKQHPGEVINDVRRRRVALEVTAHGRPLGVALVPTDAPVRASRPTGAALRHLARSYGTDTTAEREQVEAARCDDPPRDPWERP